MSNKKYTGIDNLKELQKRDVKKIRKKKFIIDSIIDSTIDTIKDEIKLLVEQFYPSAELDYYIEIYQAGSQKYIQFYIYTKGGDWDDDVCINITFNPYNKSIYISDLSKCLINGRKNLTNVIQIGHRLNYKFIELLDAATINYNHSVNEKYNCSFSLSIYNLLLKGRRWYNKYGFKGKNHEQEKYEINEIRNRLFVSNIIDYSQNGKSDSKLVNYLLEFVYNTLPNYYNINIYKKTKNVFKDLENIRKTLSTDYDKNIFFCGLKDLIVLFRNNINYEYKLIYKIR